MAHSLWSDQQSIRPLYPPSSGDFATMELTYARPPLPVALVCRCSLCQRDVTWLPRFFLSIVVQYIDGQPARIHEDFNNFALEALRANWPCSRGANAHDPLAVALY